MPLIIIILFVLLVTFVIIEKVKNKTLKTELKNIRQTAEKLSIEIEELKEKQSAACSGGKADDDYERYRAQRREQNRQEILDMLERNASNANLRENNHGKEKKHKIPWFAAGMAYGEAKDTIRKLRQQNRELQKAVEKINKEK
ncbi:MAG: hypothetical protein J5590_07710 [Clostridia bacterium]|nr:hypothetical protein [Clostridia bacterium]